MNKKHSKGKQRCHRRECEQQRRYCRKEPQERQEQSQNSYECRLRPHPTSRKSGTEVKGEELEAYHTYIDPDYHDSPRKGKKYEKRAKRSPRGRALSTDSPWGSGNE